MIAADTNHFERVIKSAHTLDLEVSDPEASELNGAEKLRGAVETLVETDRRPDGRLQSGQILESFAGKRLLEHHEAEFIERAEDFQILDRISAVRIDEQRDVA